MKGRLVRHKWMCECNPRQYAKHFETKKPGKNKGRWFYVCQKDQKDKNRCDFFLWDDDAKTREKICLRNNTDSEEETREEQTANPPPRRPTPPPAHTVAGGAASNAARKRGRAALEDEDDEFGGFDQGDPAFNNELEQAMEAAETPRKAARIDPYSADAFTTPTRRKLPWMKDGPSNGLPTPQTGGRSNDLFPTPFVNPGSSLLTPSKFREAEEDIEGTTQDPGSQHSAHCLDTPTPARFREGGSGSREADALATKITSTLIENGVRMNLTAEGKLRSLVASNMNGRQATREYLDRKVDRVQHEKRELHTRIEALEKQLEEQKALVRVLTNQIREMGSQPEFE
ncbi:hypothetical protein BDV96DRAFT_651920 [Lophiotrema nucula]|uniref:GRF-type domain-containing protein n=1 Tax=Lophiotrema nucula TaxID=690887 RepID=A0A6A5YTS4_9PLEO|nr:hypothetical protein BDV96DRAFT_651920 [Lophiotrema nucula]